MTWNHNGGKWKGAFDLQTCLSSDPRKGSINSKDNCTSDTKQIYEIYEIVEMDALTEKLKDGEAEEIKKNWKPF